MSIKRYKKKPIPVEVIQFTGGNGQEISTWSNNVVLESKYNNYSSATFLKIYTLEGVMTCDPGSYIVKGNEGEFWAVKQSIFEATYEEVND